MNLAILVFVIGSVFEAAEPSKFAYLQVVRIQYLGAAFISPLILLFIMDFCEIKIKLWRHILPLLAFPAFIAVSMYLRPDIMTPAIEIPGSLLRYLYFGYTYIMMILALILAFFYYPKRDAIFKKQITIIGFAIIIPMLGSFLAVFIDIIHVDITALCLSASGVFIGYALLFGGLLDIAPIAREVIVENMRDGFILVDIAGNFLDANSAAKKLFPALKTASVGQPMNRVDGIRWNESGGFDEQTLSIGTETGVRHYRTSFDVVRHEGAAICQCITVYDITPVQELLNETIRLAEYDSLTGLLNRRAFSRKVKEKCMEMERSGGGAMVLMMDLDYFKKINDTYGHPAGDEVLRAVSGKLLSRFRKTDLLSRYGGEEFCAFLPATNESGALKIAEECIRAMEKMEIEFEGKTVRVTISIGLAKYDSGLDLSIENIIAQADAALYAAKENGRNRYILFNAKSAPSKS